MRSNYWRIAIDSQPYGYHMRATVRVKTFELNLYSKHSNVNIYLHLYMYISVLDVKRVAMLNEHLLAVVYCMRNSTMALVCQKPIN